MTDLRLPPDGDEPLDPTLERLADAILDGRAIDWSAYSRDQAITSLSNELQLVAGVAAVHRSLPDADATSTGFPPEYPWHVGTLIITAPLGHGTYGEVFRAWDTQLHRDVALKLLFPRSTRSEAGPAALDEGRILARVRHPNVLAVYAAEQIDGRVGLATEFIRGQTLAQVVRDRGPLPAADAARIAVDLCRALAAVHGAGLLHRDIKAQNVMREDGGRIVLMDFGASHEGDAVHGLAGTPLYLAPEVLDGKPATTASDVYSLGVLLYYLVTGRYPVTGGSVHEIRRAHRDGERAPLRSAPTGIPRRLAAAINRAIDPDPSRRFQTGEAFSSALRRGRVQVTAGRVAAAITIGAASVAAYALWPRPLPAANVASPRVARLTVPPHMHFGGPSFDGRSLVYVEPRGAVWVTETTSGQSRKVIESDFPKAYATAAILSPDGRRLAYTWTIANAAEELRVLEIDERWPTGAFRQSPHLVARFGPTSTVSPRDWSRDGQLLLTVVPPGGGVEVALASSSGTGYRVVRRFPGIPPRRVTLSPDGRFLAYDEVTTPPSPQRDIFILPLEGKATPRLLAGGAENQLLPVWSADGRHVIYVSDSDGETDAWKMEVRDGQPTGRRRRVARGFDLVTPVRQTALGDYVYAQQTSVEELHVVPLKPLGDIAARTAKIPSIPGSLRAPAWSPDGNTLAHFVIRGMSSFADFGTFIRFVDTRSGATHAVVPQLAFFGGSAPKWSPSGDALLIRGRGFDGQWGIHIVGATTGATQRVTPSDPRHPESNLGMVYDWVPGADGLILYEHRPRGIVERSLATGHERVLVPSVAGSSVTGLGISPDGARLAYSVVTGPRESAESVLRIREADGTIRDLAKMKADGSLYSTIYFTAWTRDGRHILHTLDGRLWLVPAAGGQRIDTGIQAESGRPRVSIDPFGRVAYDSGRSSFEIWMMKGLAR